MENKLKEALKKLGIETAEQLNAAIKAGLSNASMESSKTKQQQDRMSFSASERKSLSCL